MHIDKDIYGDDIVIHENDAEWRAAYRAYKSGDWSNLTRLEIKQFRDLEEDPDNVRYDAEHQGRFSEDIDQFDVDGQIFIHDIGHTLEEGRQMVLDAIGPHPITPLNVMMAIFELKGAL